MGFLAEILPEIRDVVRAPQYLAGLPTAPPSPPKSFRSAIERGSPAGALIAEYKRLSPGRPGPRRPERSIDEFARLVAPGPIAGFSCLACEPRFQGSPRDVARLAAQTDRPVLFKDFVLGRAQVEAARRAGASAVLLIARLAGSRWLEAPLEELAREAHAHGLEVLLELHDEAEIRDVRAVAADVYGVNVRDLDTLRLEPEVAERTFAALNAPRPCLGLSGIEGPLEADRFWSWGADGVVVGSALAETSDPVRLLEGLRRPASTRAE